jgi:hypothetical protein
VVTSTDPVIDTLVPQSTPALQTITMVTGRTVAPQPEMELLPKYQEDQQALAYAK